MTQVVFLLASLNQNRFSRSKNGAPKRVSALCCNRPFWATDKPEGAPPFLSAPYWGGFFVEAQARYPFCLRDWELLTHKTIGFLRPRFLGSDILYQAVSFQSHFSPGNVHLANFCIFVEENTYCTPQVPELPNSQGSFF